MASVKREMIGDPLEVILKHIRKAPGGQITDDVLGTQCSEISPKDRVTVVNRLLDNNQIELKQVGDKTAYQYKKEVIIPKEVQPVEEAVYRLIAESETQGITRREIDNKVNIGKKDLTKLLNSLEQRSLIKKVARVPKVRYMLFALQPDRSVTGGAFYEGDRFDSDLVEGITQILKPHMHDLMNKEKARNTPMNLICRAASLSPRSAADWLNSKQFVKFQLTEEDTRQLLDAMVLEGFAEKQEDWYHAHYKDQPMSSSGLSFTPCGVCPQTEQCRPGGVVSPENCSYMTEFLW